jgi:hypothetical protein
MSKAVVALLAWTVVAAFASGVAAAQTPSPQLTMEEECTQLEGVQLYGVLITVTGLPGGSVYGSLTWPDGTTVEDGVIGSNEAGVAMFRATSSIPGTFTVRITSPFSATQSIVVDCLPTDAQQCKNGGWRNYGSTFSNQGDCVSFVTHQARQECLFIRAAHGQPAFRAQYGTPVTEQHAMRRCVRQRSED